MRQDFWKGRRVLITGANGFLGSWLAKALVERGAEVVALDRSLPQEGGLGLMGVASRVEQVPADLADYGTVLQVLGEHQPDTVFHLAAQAIVGAANESPLPTFEANIRGTWCVLEACRRMGETVHRVVVASSDKAYGEQEELPYKENSPLLARYPYDASKACADILAGAYAATYRMPVVVTRCANLYGGGDLNLSRIVPDTLRHVLRGERPVLRSDGTLERDYLYVEDAVEAYLLLGERAAEPGIAGEAFNFGSGRPLRVLDLVKRILELAGLPDLSPILGPGSPQGEISRQYLSCVKAQRLLGWQPQRDIDSGLRLTIEWYRSYWGERGDAGRAGA